MNNEAVCNTLQIIKESTDRNVTLRALVKLRTDVVKDRDGIVQFRNCGGVAPMIRLLHKPHEKILETVLSILGNCCTNLECCNECIEHKIMAPLVTILKSIPNPLIQSRACRLLGNLAKEKRSEVVEKHNTALSHGLTLILEETTESQTQVMALRAARFLLGEKSFVLALAQSNGYKHIANILVKLMKNPASERASVAEEPKPVGLKRNQHREKYFEEVARHLEGVRSDIFDNEMLKNVHKSNEYMLPSAMESLKTITEILKCIHVLSEQHIPALDIQVFTNPTALTCVVFLAEENTCFRSPALKIISNFAKNCNVRQVLSSAGSIVAACELLGALSLETALSDGERRHCIHIICMLASDACNRAKIRRSGTLGKLLKIAKDSKSHSEISLILNGLNNFQYDSMSMELLVREGLVGLLVRELDEYLEGTDEYRIKACDAKKYVQKRRSEIIITAPNKVQKLFEDMDSPSSSPNYGSSTSSPCSSRSMSPTLRHSHVYALDTENDAESYSPVCSEDEGMDDDDNEADFSDTVNKDENIPSEEAILDKDEDDVSQDIPTAKQMDVLKLTNSSLDVIENLLFRVTLAICKTTDLGKFETLNSIIQAVRIFGVNTNFTGCLSNILSLSQFFAPIIKQGVIHKIYEVTKITDKKSCAVALIDILTAVSETGYGKGEITRLLKSSLDAQKRAAIAVAFIVKSPKQLYQYITEFGSLYILINSILDKGDDNRVEATDALTSLAETLDLCVPKMKKKQKYEIEFEETLHFPTNFNNGGNETEMKFIIHRGCSKIPISFSKSLLTNYSNIFETMLNGNFREGQEGEIHLKGYSIHGIKYFLNMVHLLSEKKPPNIPPIHHFESLLEACELSRMYIMEDMENILTEMIIHRIDENNCLRLLQWSLKKMNPELSNVAINYYLSVDLSGLAKVHLFREADYSDIAKEWNEMLVDAVLVRCQNLCNANFCRNDSKLLSSESY